MLPILLELTGRLAVVIGGGAVARRKAAALLDAGAAVRLVCLEPHPQDAPALDWRTEPYHSDHLAGAALVFAAATPEVNRQVVADAQARGLWVNSASEPEAGDFFLPAVVRRGDLILAISTGGAAPLLAQQVRQQLEEQFDETFGHWVALLAELRPLVLAQITDPQQRRQLFERWCAWPWLERLRQEGVAAVRAAMETELRSLAAGSPPSL